MGCGSIASMQVTPGKAANEMEGMWKGDCAALEVLKTIDPLTIIRAKVGEQTNCNLVIFSCVFDIVTNSIVVPPAGR